MPADLADALRLYDYRFPERLIAQRPASPRDSARLVVLDRATGERTWTRCRQLGEFLPPGTLLILNRTKVIPAKLELTRASGGRVTALSLRTDGDTLVTLCNRRLRLGEALRLPGGDELVVEAADGRAWQLRAKGRSAAEVLKRWGSTPLPPYIKHCPLTEAQRRTRYQSVFARAEGSIAAPTASLHLTPRLLKSLKERGVEFADVVLHVHLGTFAPLTDEQWGSGRLHVEHYEIPNATVEAVARARARGGPVVALGTTALRALESAADGQGRLTRLSGDTDLFIREGYRFRVVQGLLTNFHVPRSSLLMLVGAFAGREAVLDLYRAAIRRDFRLFSFGDAMLLL